MKQKNKSGLILVLAVVFLFYLYAVLPSVISWGPIGNYRNVSVRTTVNITDAMPEILNITCNGGSSITLSAGTTTPVVCLVEIRDWNGGNTIQNNGSVNATFYYYLNLSSQPNDNNTHYTNTSCAVNATSGYYINYTCGFNVQYFANNGTWTINATVIDRNNPNMNYSVSGYANATINQLFALNVTEVIDFGNMYVGETSQTAVEANITNFGNMNINVTLYGYGGEDQSLYGNLAMICDVRNISMTSERFSTNVSAPWSSMTAISGTSSLIANLSLPQQQDDSVQVRNATYWRLYVDPADNPFGRCNGTVIFSAVAAN